MNKEKFKNKGFTLVELLAIIVVLGIIAIIIVPRIINTVENSKQDSAIVSAKGYMDSVTKYYVEKNTAGYDNLGNKAYGIEITGVYTIDSGVLMDSENNKINVPFTGAPPKSGTVYIRSGEIIYGCITIGKYSVIVNESNILRSIEGECDQAFNDLPVENREDGYKYFKEPIVVYYNPTTNELCDSGISSNKERKTEGCLRWYAYNYKNNVSNLILDHNINPSGDSNGETVESISETDYQNGTALAAELGVTNIGSGSYGTGNNDKGPLTALKYLKTKTSNWQSSVSGEYSTYTANVASINYSVNYSGYKARFITAEEVFYTKYNSYDLTATVASNVSEWIGENLSQANHYEGTEAYYTISPAFMESGAPAFWNVHDENLTTNYITPESVYTPDYTGVRPVVSLDTSKVKIYMK